MSSRATSMCFFRDADSTTSLGNLFLFLYLTSCSMNKSFLLSNLNHPCCNLRLLLLVLPLPTWEKTLIPTWLQPPFMGVQRVTLSFLFSRIKEKRLLPPSHVICDFTSLTVLLWTCSSPFGHSPGSNSQGNSVTDSAQADCASPGLCAVLAQQDPDHTWGLWEQQVFSPWSWTASSPFLVAFCCPNPQSSSLFVPACCKSYGGNKFQRDWDSLSLLHCVL